MAGVPMNDRPLYRNGRVTTKVRDLPDGSILMFKPFLVREEHIMKMTGAPGWDKKHVDDTFMDGVVGSLRYTFDIVQYDIPIADFREHAFESETVGFGVQYHVHQKFYKTTGLRVINPKRESLSELPTLPKKVTFGRWVPCTRCKSSGKEPGKQKERCSKCQGQGFLPVGSSASS